MKIKKNFFWITGYIVLDLFCAGAGMGVPIFNIIFGFFVGLFLARRFSFKKTFKFALLTAGFTFLLMLLIWGRVGLFLLNPAFDFANFGIPQILYAPLSSFIGWLVLMIFISPFLQLLTTVFAAYWVFMQSEIS